DQLRTVRAKTQGQDTSGVPGKSVTFPSRGYFDEMNARIAPPAGPRQQPAIGRKSYRANAVGQFGETVQQVARSQIAQLQKPTLAAEGNGASVRRNRGVVDRAAANGGVRLRWISVDEGKLTYLPVSGKVPQIHHVVFAVPHDQHAAVRSKCRAVVVG